MYRRVTSLWPPQSDFVLLEKVGMVPLLSEKVLLLAALKAARDTCLPSQVNLTHPADHQG